MACTDNSGGGIPGLPGWASGITTFLSEWLPLFINLWIMYEMLEAQEEAESAMEDIAKKSLSAAEQLFDAQMEFRNLDDEIYEFANTQPLYTPCDRSHHATTAKRLATELLTKSRATSSRYDCGNRYMALHESMRLMVVGTQAERQSIRQFETELEDQYLQNYYDSSVSFALASEPNYLAGAFASSAALWGVQQKDAQTQAAGAMAGVGYFGGNLISRWMN